MNTSRASAVLMIRPAGFSYNTETAGTNSFQQRANNDLFLTQVNALAEFEGLASLLQNEGVKVIAIDDTTEPHTPDAIFPNNWISFHEDGSVVLYPMLAPNRRLERRSDIIDAIGKDFSCTEVYDMSGHEKEERFLEGTGSLVIDYRNKVIYAVRSQRTSEELVKELSARLGYEPVIFTALDRQGEPVYHTNVVMCIGEGFAVVCLDCIPATEREMITRNLERSGKTIIPITPGQVERFAGNMYELVNDKDEHLLLMSSQAYRSLKKEQVNKLSAFCRIIHTPLDTIELHGGGSARCMIADIRLPRRSI